MRDFSSDLSALALNTATLGHNLDGYGAGWEPEQVIDACAERGLGGIAFWRREIGSRAVEIGTRAREAGLRVVGLCRSPYLVGPEAPSDIDDAKAAIDMAAALGAPVLTVVTGGSESGTLGLGESRKILADRVSAIAGFAAERGVSLALEPLNPMYAGGRSVLATVRDALDACDAVAAPNVGVAVDVYHVWWDAGFAGDLAESGRGRVFGFHLCDWLRDTRDMMLDRGMMGDGIADIRGIRAAVENTGYQGACEVEIFSAWDWWQRDPGETLDVIVERFRTAC